MEQIGIYCPFCGKPCQVDGEFCAHCGKSLPHVDTTRSATDADQKTGGSDDSHLGVMVAARQTTGTAVVAAPEPDAAQQSTVADPPGAARACAERKLLLPSPPRPWLRYWARTVDVLMAFVVSGLYRWHNYFSVLIGMLLWIPFEAAFLSSCGTTPGKWLFNIRLSDKEGSRLPFATCLRRAFAVVLKGQGLGIPMVSLFTGIFAYRTLNSKGRTSWDAQYGVIVKHEELGVGRVLGVVVTPFVILELIHLRNFFK